MNMKHLNSIEEIRNEFQRLFKKSPAEKVEHRAQMLSFIFLSEAQKVMDHNGWTRKQLADEIGTSASYLTQLFRGDRLLNLKTTAKIENALGIEFGITVSEGEGHLSEISNEYHDTDDLKLRSSQVNEPY